MTSLVTVTSTSGSFDSIVRVPGSKSVANRAMVCAALADGVSVLRNVPGGDDCNAMVAALGATNVDGTVSISAVDIGGARWDAALAGTTSRFLTAIGALGVEPTVIDGGEPLRRRPMADLHDALQMLGATVEPLGESGHLPVSVSRGALHGGEVAIRGDVSSQFISALMLIGPYLPGGLRIVISGELVSRPYVEMTARVMGDFGASAVVDETTVRIAQGRYRARSYDVEPDFSSAAFPLCALVVAPGRVRIPMLADARSQADSEILPILSSMGVRTEIDGRDVVAWRGSDDLLSPLVKDMSQCSDLVPAVAVACCCAAGMSELSGIGFIRGKESDRLGDVARELRKLGALIEVDDDGLRISGGVPLRGARLSTHHDHRLAMAFALLGLRVEGLQIEDPEVVSKSWPSFFTDMEGLIRTIATN